jgi:hypothetical protein
LAAVCAAAACGKLFEPLLLLGVLQSLYTVVLRLMLVLLVLVLCLAAVPAG